MKKFVVSITTFALVFALVGSVSPASAAVPVSSLNSGDLIRGESLSALYYLGEDGFRYVFPNDKTYFTWYENFDGVKTISDADLTTIQLGGNVTYKPGVKMIKITSDPKTYAVDEGGVLRWVTSEAVAISLYGENWNQMIDDVPDGFFPNYDISGASIDQVGEYNAEEVRMEVDDINDNKDLKDPIIVRIEDDGYSPSEVEFEAGRAVRFMNAGDDLHAATANDLSWGSGTIQPGGHFSRYFKEAGTYNFFDNYNPETITGTLDVN